MVAKTSIKLPNRKKYTIKTLMTDLKKINPTPNILRKIGNEIIYFEWTSADRLLGSDHPVTVNFGELLEYTENGYEQELVQGKLWRIKDTPKSSINSFLTGRPNEFLTYTFDRPADYIKQVLDSAIEESQKEKEQLKRYEQVIRQAIKENPEDSDSWNRLRVVLWLMGKYRKATDAYRKAKKLGWNPETSKLVAI
jgi:tetratricopeptide (TPR) repeat protein